MPAILDAPSARAGREGGGSDFTPLARRVRESGLLERRPGYYGRAIGLNLAATAALWAAVAFAGGSWWVVLLAVPLAVVSTRTAFLGHDAGHRQIAGSARANRLLGLALGNLLLGMGHGWWSDKHNRHHANPNHVGKDPDVGEGVLAWTREQAVRQRGPLRWVARHQAALFFPLLTLEGFNLKIGSALFLRERGRRERLVEGGLLVLHAVGYLGLVFALLSPGKAVVLVLLHQALFGVHLGSVFAPNHKGMAMPEPGARWGHLRRQVLTSRNVRGGAVTDWLMGGLNYQIEHHLFPSVPRCNLRRVQPLVREHCARLGLPFAEAGLVESYRLALGHMREVGEPLRG
ncbi:MULTISPECIES: acyl-CoA desaturase [Actinomadura]|uniref:Acyl-CoA desaturase n=1 Tax=Actinomadura litoris TaxID=2678616 RepID=A0A7K1KYL3_9ACTN|nr:MULTISPECIES: acyl-CoA desaturase [Actinomadura]MBT2212214.1 acyl-CoA desaturase [Actinomadura sp. NEAU-AAG7]MUN37294.1 acyl-CoA desaturase [Actinomadura litoris]